MKPRIIHIISSLHYGGAAKRMCTLAAGMNESRYDVSVCAIRSDGPLGDELRRAGVQTACINARAALDPLAFWRLRREAQRLQPAVVHSWDAESRLFAHAAADAANASHVVDMPTAAPSRLWLDRTIRRRVAGACREIVVNCAAYREVLIRDGLPGDKIRHIPGGVPAVEPSPVTRRQLLDELGLPEDIRLLAAVGSLKSHKQLKDAIWAADLLKVVRDDVHLLIVGDGPHAARLHKFREQVEIEDKVHFLGPRGDVSRILPHADVFWSTAKSGGQSRAILEAMSAGVPVVAAESIGTRELIVDGKTGYLVPPGDRAGIARATTRLLDDPKLRQHTGIAARQRAAEQFSAEKMIQSYEDLYGEIL